MSDGAKTSEGLKFCTICFSYEDCQKLCTTLDKLYGLKTSIHSAVTSKPFQDVRYNIYILEESMDLLRDIVMPHMEPSMKYKIM